jgi:hypothetical protein
LKADKIIHKGTFDELEALPYYKKIKHKPHHLFREFVTQSSVLTAEQLLPKLSAKDGKIHLVYTGTFYYDDCHLINGRVSHLKCLMSIADNCKDFVIHIYPLDNYKFLASKDYAKIFVNYDQFVFHRNVSHDVLVRELSQYDLGVCWLDHNPKIIKPIWVKTEFCNKLFDFLCARLPTIYYKNSFAIHEFFRGNGLGVGFDDIKQVNRENIERVLREFKFHTGFVPDGREFLEFVGK